MWSEKGVPSRSHDGGMQNETMNELIEWVRPVARGDGGLKAYK